MREGESSEILPFIFPKHVSLKLVVLYNNIEEDSDHVHIESYRRRT